MKFQVVILAGGESSRFYPFNNIHKSFFELAGKRIIDRTIENALKTHPSKIIVVLGKANFEEEREILGKSEFFGDIEVVCQEKPQGMADAILAAEGCITESFFVINAQQINFSLHAEDFLSKFKKGDYLAVLGSSETDEPQKYGVFEFKSDEISGIIEKPETDKAPSNKRVVGTYLFDKEFIKTLKDTPKSEYSLESALNESAKDGKVAAVNMPSDSPSLKYPWDILELKNLILNDMHGFISKEAVIEKTAIIKGKNVFIDSGARVCEFAIVEGPAYIGKNAVVGAYSQVRSGSILEDSAQTERYTDVKNSYVGRGTHMHSGFIGDSVIGQYVRIGAEFITANKRLDRKQVFAKVKGEEVNTGRTSLGIVIGDNSKIAIRTSSMPGTIVGSDCTIYPGEILKGTYKEGVVIKD